MKSMMRVTQEVNKKIENFTHACNNPTVCIQVA